jgi:predicted transcriptional regulator YdeE
MLAFGRAAWQRECIEQTGMASSIVTSGRHLCHWALLMHDVVVSAGDLLVAGIKVRTTHRIEAVALTAKIPALWRRFLADKVGEQIPDRSGDAAVLAIYTDYEREDSGPFSVVLGHRVTTLEHVPPGMSGVWLLPGRYLSIEGAGRPFEYPSEAWQEIRRFFAHSHAYERAFESDYEIHTAEAVAIYVSIK